MYSQARSVAARTYLPWLLVAAVAVTALLTAFLNPSPAGSSVNRPATFAKDSESACMAHYASFWPPLLAPQGADEWRQPASDHGIGFPTS